MRLLAGDIGGTKTVLQLYERRSPGADGRAAGAFELLDQVRVASADHPGLEPIAVDFVGSRSIDAAVFGVAGPVRDGRCRTTNLPWQLDQRVLAEALACPARLINDFAAVVMGVDGLSGDELRVLQVGEREQDGPIAVLGAGTGLGEGVGVRTAGGLVAIAGEGGHRDLGARNALEDRLVAYLRQRFGGRASVERVVSGLGIATLYEFVLAEGLASENPQVAAEMRAGDTAEVVGRRGQDGSDGACVRALDLFIGLYGAEAGNLALSFVPTGGLFVAGGIAPKLLERIERGDFMAALLDKGRMAPVLERIPVAVILNAGVGLLGARAVAATLTSAG